MISLSTIFVTFIAGFFCLHSLAVIPLGALTTRKLLGTSTVIYGAPGSFSGSLTEEKDAVFVRLVKPVSGYDGCNPVPPSFRNNQNFYLLVSRGNCSFLDKTIAALNIGASGIVVFNSIEGIYQGNDYASSDDYDCANGSGYVDNVLSPIYSDEMTALMPSSCTLDSKCSSKRCVLTNSTRSELGNEVCCAWDLYTTMSTSIADTDNSFPDIPAMFIRMEDVDTIEAFDELDSLTLEVAIYQRPTSVFDFASILVWLIAVLTAATGAAIAAEEDKLHQQGGEFKMGHQYRNRNIGYQDPSEGSEATHPLVRTIDRGKTASMEKGGNILVDREVSQMPTFPSLVEVDVGSQIPSLGSGVIEDLSSFSKSSASPEGRSTTFNGTAFPSVAAPSNSSSGIQNSWVENRDYRSCSSDSSQNVMQTEIRSSSSGIRTRTHVDRLEQFKISAATSQSYSPQGLSDNEDVEADALQITGMHAVGFIVLSSSFLLIMYFIDIYFLVSLLYLSAAGFASSKVFLYPFFSRLVRTYNAIQLGVEIEAVTDYSSSGDCFGVNLASILSGLTSACLCITWYLFHEHLGWIWILQNFLGVSVCILFLSSVHLPNLQTATMLLGLAFCYDVFFVFLSPYVFGSSVMVTVASGQTLTAHSDENFCEKYPSDSDCNINTLPMLMIVPTFSSYLSSESLLGLGDIVLPGLLLVWAARLDIRRYGSLSSRYASRGYFPMMVFGYATGLMAANFAVSYFETGQPALLYIVPLTLGPVLFRSFRAESLPELWKSLPRMKTVAQPFDRAEQEALLAGRSSLLLAEATWGEKAADVSIDYLAYSQSIEGESVSCEPYDSAAVAVPSKTMRDHTTGNFTSYNRSYSLGNNRRDNGLI